MKNEDILFYWSLVSVNWDETHSNELLQLIVQQWIIVSAFHLLVALWRYIKNIRSQHRKQKDLEKLLLQLARMTD